GTKGRSSARACAVAASVAPRTVRPLRASDVHDSRVRRIAAITPDMVCPKTARLHDRRMTTVRESRDNIPKGSWRVRVQTVNANPGTEKCRIKPYRRNFYENESAL